jgi:hypothetical protein
MRHDDILGKLTAHAGMEFDIHIRRILHFSWELAIGAVLFASVV